VRRLRLVLKAREKLELLDFNIVFDRVVGIESGYVNNPNDPGGETKWGISKHTYPQLNIKDLTRDEAKEIYHRDFWEKLEMESLPPGIVYQLFDFALNSGIHTAIRYFQRALGVADDGYFGPISRIAAKNTSECDMIMQLNAERLDFMTRLNNWPNASRGWARRIAINLRYGALDT
jgi:lysozyme family protein